MASTRANRMETTLSDGIRHRRHVRKKISVRKLNGEIVELEMYPMETIASVKTMIEEEGIHPRFLQIEFDGEVLDDDRTLADYSIQKDSTLTLTKFHYVEPSPPPPPPRCPPPSPQVPDLEMESTDAGRMEATPLVQRSPVFAGTRNDDNKNEGLRRRLLRGDYIFIRQAHVNMTFTLKVDLTETIASVKAKIQEKGIVLPQPELWYYSKKLENDRTLADYDIQRNSNLILVPKLSSLGRRSGGERKKFFVKTETDLSLTFESDLSETIAGLKVMIMEKRGCLLDDMRLILLGGVQVEDDRTLADYNVENGSIFFLVLRQRGGGMSITVEKPNGPPFRLNVSSGHTISQIKDMVNERDEEQGIHQEQTKQHVEYEGKRLDDDSTLAYNNVKGGSTLSLVDTLGGGGSPQLEDQQILHIKTEHPTSSNPVAPAQLSSDSDTSASDFPNWKKSGRRIRNNPTRSLHSNNEYGMMQTEQTAGPSAPAAGGQGHNQLSSGSITPVSRQVVHGSDTPADQLRQKQRRSYKYSIKALLFAIAILATYLSSASASFSPGKMAFKIAIGAFFIVDATLSILKPPNWSSALTYLSWFFLELVSYLLLVSFNKYYSYAILPAVFLPIIAVLHHRLQPGATQQITTHNEANHNVDTERTDQDHVAYDEDGQSFDDIFDSSAEIVNCGGFITAVFGNSMVGPASALGFLFFNTVALGLYLMMVTTVRTAALTLHVRCLTKLLKVLLLSTLITALIHGSSH